MSDSSNTLELLDTAAVAKILKVSPRTLEGWRSNGRTGQDSGPTFVKQNGVVRYLMSDVTDWITKNRVTHASTT